MKRSSVHFAFGLLATAASVIQIAWSVFFAIGGYQLLAEKFDVSIKAFGFLNFASNAIIWGLFAAAFFILTIDKRNILSALLGGISCVILALAAAVSAFHWSLTVICFFLFVGYSLAVAFLKTSVPSVVRIAAIIAIGLIVLLSTGWTGASIYSQFYGWEKVSSFYGVYGKIAIWPNILCWVVLTAHFALMAITCGNEREDTGSVQPNSNSLAFSPNRS